MIRLVVGAGKPASGTTDSGTAFHTITVEAASEALRAVRGDGAPKVAAVKAARKLTDGNWVLVFVGDDHCVYVLARKRLKSFVDDQEALAYAVGYLQGEG